MCNMKIMLVFSMYMCNFGISIAMVVRKPRFRFTSSDYDIILKTSGFIDKTLMIQHILQDPSVALITAPPRFGKSTNLDMLKRFFEIEVYEDGSLQTKANLTTEAVTETNNYKLFVDNHLKITENKTIMIEHFGKTPVMKVDMRCLNVVKTYDEGVQFCKSVVHNTYKQYRYLLNSERLNPSQKMAFEKWSNDSTYQSLSIQHVAHGLRMLSIYLYRHFYERRVLILIDNHDSIIEQAMFDVEGAEVLRKIIALSVSMMSTAVKNNDIYVKGGLITGISDIPVFGFSDLNKMKTYRFLGHHQFLDYYGLTKGEADFLFKKPEFNLDPELVKEAHAAYNGYQSERGKKIYNIYSVLRFLKVGGIKNFWTKYGTIKKLKSVFKIPAFKHYVDKLTEGKTISIAILEQLSVEDVIDLRNLLLKPHSQINYWPATLFNYLFKQGYLTYMPGSREAVGVSVKKSTVKLPNTEVTAFFKKLK